MKKLLCYFLLCTMSVYLSSCIGCSTTNDEVEYKSEYGQYHNPYGGRQKYYKGSVEQQRDLAEIDAYFNEHGWD